MRPRETGWGAIRVRRAQTINQAIRDAAAQVNADIEALPEPWREKALGAALPLLIQDHFADWPLLRDDDPALHIETLSQLTQDPTEDPVAHQIASARQDLLYQWLAQMQAQQAMAMAPPGSPAGPVPAGARQAGQGGMAPTAAGTQTSESLASASDEVGALTQEAKGAA